MIGMSIDMKIFSKKTTILILGAFLLLFLVMVNITWKKSKKNDLMINNIIEVENIIYPLSNKNKIALSNGIIIDLEKQLRESGLNLSIRLFESKIHPINYSFLVSKIDSEDLLSQILIGFQKHIIAGERYYVFIVLKNNPENIDFRSYWVSKDMIESAPLYFEE